MRHNDIKLKDEEGGTNFEKKKKLKPRGGIEPYVRATTKVLSEPTARQSGGYPFYAENVSYAGTMEILERAGGEHYWHPTGQTLLKPTAKGNYPAEQQLFYHLP